MEIDEEVTVSSLVDDAKKVESLMADLASERGLTRQRARATLIAIGKPAVGPLITLMDDPRRPIRWEAAKALGEIADPAAAPVLVNALEDKGIGVRWLAGEGLIGMGRGGLRPLLQALVHHSDSEWLREGAHHVLRGLTREGMSEDDMTEIVLPVLRRLEGVEPTITVPRAAEAALDALDASSTEVCV